MKTAEERRADREARILADVSGPRTGYIPEATAEPPAPSPIVRGLKLSDVQLWPRERFKLHPSNAVFDSAKTEAYWRDLRRDILEAGAIINPVIALPDGTLLEGHSRLRILGELAAEGKDLGKVPVRVVASPITPEEAERRVYLGNLSRFELKDKTRLTLYAKVWPDYFLEKKKAGRPPENNGVTVTPLPATAREIAEATGKSESTIKRDKRTVQKAAKIAKKKGKHTPDAEDIREAREKAAAQRRSKSKAPVFRSLPQPRQALGIIVELTPADVEETLTALSVKPNTHRREIIKKLRNAKATARKGRR